MFFFQWLACATYKDARVSAISMRTATEIPKPAWPVASSKTPSVASIKQATTKPVTNADRAGEGPAFHAEKSMTPIPAYKAAPRRAINPTEYEKSTPQRDSMTLAANIQMSASEKKTSADRIARLRKVSFIANHFMQGA